jgi:hypothetical protein
MDCNQLTFRDGVWANHCTSERNADQALNTIYFLPCRMHHSECIPITSEASANANELPQVFVEAEEN